MVSPDEQPPRWLSPADLEAWLAVVALVMRLPGVLDSQLTRDSGLSHLEYSVLAMLSENEEHTRRLSELAMITNSSLSRLSHLISRIEERGLVRREADPHDGRYTNAVLTDEGYELLKTSAPGHVERVRSAVLDAVGPEEFHHFGRTAARIVKRLEELN
ncbi:MAG: MarR family winged helix-turn-helix transcriptional regulator [Segniliparus sp.]|uniref:MarR family winged helix-turn-helix transcriptional regulator n=1 Tax=Segniliparus sp. TaxID=2804064 RepID=UPI003F399345